MIRLFWQNWKKQKNLLRNMVCRILSIKDQIQKSRKRSDISFFMKKNLKELRALNKRYNISVTIDKNMRDHSNDPFVLASLKRAEEFIAKHGLPESITKPNKSRKPKQAQSSKPKA